MLVKPLGEVWAAMLAVKDEGARAPLTHTRQKS